MFRCLKWLSVDYKLWVNPFQINKWGGDIFYSLYTSIFLKEWKYGDGKKNRVRDYCRFWFYYTQNMKKSRFPKSVCVSVDFFFLANDNCRKFKQNQIIFCIQPWFVAVSYTHLDVYKRQVTKCPVFRRKEEVSIDYTKRKDRVMETLL